MASGFERFIPVGDGMREVLRSDEVRADMERRAQRVKAAAESIMGDGDNAWPRGIVADSTIGAGRASATVIGVWYSVEVDRRILGSAIDAAGG